MYEYECGDGYKSECQMKLRIDFACHRELKKYHISHFICQMQASLKKRSTHHSGIKCLHRSLCIHVDSNFKFPDFVWCRLYAVFSCT